MSIVEFVDQNPAITIILILAVWAIAENFIEAWSKRGVRCKRRRSAEPEERTR